MWPVDLKFPAIEILLKKHNSSRCASVRASELRETDALRVSGANAKNVAGWQHPRMLAKCRISCLSGQIGSNATFI